MGVLKKDVKKLRSQLRDKERTVLAIEGDLTNLLDLANKASSMSSVVQAVQQLFRTHVKGEGGIGGGHGGGHSSRDGDERLTAAEAMQQKEYLQRACDVLKTSLAQAEAGAMKQKKKTMHENSLLIEECNMLRKEKATFAAEIQELQEKLKQCRRNMKQLVQRSKESERSRGSSRTPSRSTRREGAPSASRPALRVAKEVPAFGVRSLSGSIISKGKGASKVVTSEMQMQLESKVRKSPSAFSLSSIRSPVSHPSLTPPPSLCAHHRWMAFRKRSKLRRSRCTDCATSCRWPTPVSKNHRLGLAQR
jgi:hypothetical protein